MPDKLRVGVAGATGIVGQRFIQLLTGHPWFELTALSASEASAGKKYGDVCRWRLSSDLPGDVGRMVVQETHPPIDCDVVFSALPADVAGTAEEAFASAGYGVFSNASAHRQDVDVPLLIPEVNHDHLSLIPIQRARRGWDRGFIVTNPNCSTVIMTLALAPLHATFGLRQVFVCTMQGLSGAGYPGVPSLDAIDNVIPLIGGEEEKVCQEPRKLLGVVKDERVEPAEFTVSAQCNRVPVRDGHMESISVGLTNSATPADVIQAWRDWKPLPQQLELPSAPQPPVVVRDEPDRPQTNLDRDAAGGMAVSVGRTRSCDILDVKFVVLGHNTIRGAAGASILNAELMVAQGLTI